MLQAMAQMKNIKEKYNNAANNNDINDIILDSLKSFFTPYCPQLQLTNTPINIKKFDIPEHKHLLAWIHNGIPTNVDNNFTGSQIADLNGAIKYYDAVVVQYVQMQQTQNKEIILSVKNKLNKYHKGAIANISIRFEDDFGNFISFLKQDITNSPD
jgi:hypothetical protein